MTLALNQPCMFSNSSMTCTCIDQPTVEFVCTNLWPGSPRDLECSQVARLDYQDRGRWGQQ